VIVAFFIRTAPPNLNPIRARFDAARFKPVSKNFEYPREPSAGFIVASDSRISWCSGAGHSFFAP
jgi:hypothetical protein